MNKNLIFSIDELNSKFEIVTGTVVNGTAIFNYPIGFTKDNCILVSAQAYISSASYWCSHNSNFVEFFLTPESIFCNFSTVYEGNPAKLMLYKYTD